MSNLSRAVMLILVVASAFALSSAGSRAEADPGVCGVRNGDTGTIPPTYYVRNRCGHDVKYRVATKYGNSNCKVVAAGDVVGYIVAGQYDPNWTIKAC